MKSFDEKVAAITGAGSGIGRALALELASAGCELALSDVNEAGLAETVALANQRGVKVTSSRVDVARREEVEAWAKRSAEEHGRVNLIFNNAGVALGSTVEGMSYADFEWLMNINFWGVVYGTKAFLPHLKASGEGHIINISSLFGLLAVPSQSAYNASKFAVRGFTEALRQELDMENACVSATSVHPGGIKTNIARSARMDRSIRDIGLDEVHGTEKFEKLFITTPQRAAHIILSAVRRRQRRVLVGPDAKFLDVIVRLFPSFYQRIMQAMIRYQMR
jgi:NAD(P)-dependent dehydrogenase (short-subunit alcohol dehydrogenase family)